MKWLFLILLLLNAGLFIWGQLQPNPLPLPTTEGTGTASNGNLLLLSEIPAEPAPAPPPAAPTEAPRTTQPQTESRPETPPEQTVVVEQEELIPAPSPDQPPPSAQIPLDQIASFNDHSPVEPGPVAQSASQPANQPAAPNPAANRPILPPAQPKPRAASGTELAIYLPPLNPPQGINDGIATNFSVNLTPPATPYRCGVLDGISDELTGYRIVEQMHMRNISAHLTKAPDDGASYWVLVPPQPTRQQAQQIIATLSRQGFNDTWLVDGGELENAVSLGLFNNRSNAQQFVTRIARLGLPVELKRQQSGKPGYAIHFPLTNKTAPGSAAWIDLNALYPSLKLRTARCQVK
jgi:hypothetical protein